MLKMRLPGNVEQVAKKVVRIVSRRKCHVQKFADFG
jgi:hypothetical protein